MKSEYISFKVTKEAARLIDEIVDRAMGECRDLDKLKLTMDLTACHANGTPLKLAELLLADRFNFIHDIYGITRHIDRSTGQLGDCFVPRFINHEVRP